jgi:BirA family biotin operon repressor/biotin-[acetyl-CoA-carboxylase] ligase
LADALVARFTEAAERDPRLAGAAKLEHHAEVDSTNDLALARAAAGAPEGTAILADLQRAGRGRRGRSWFSPPGAGLYLSIVARPRPDRLSLVTLVAGMAAARAVTGVTGLPVQLKWPNDLVVGRPWRKLGGVLSEAVTSGTGVGAVVMGIGINLRPAAYPPELADRATSIEGELGRATDRGAVVIETIAGVLDGMARLRREPDYRWVRESWRTLVAPGSFGAAVRWSDQDGERRGLALDIDEDGALVVDADGARERIVAGEVTWERLS